MEPVVEEAEGYKLFLSNKSSTGYLGVRFQTGRFYARRGLAAISLTSALLTRL